MCAPSCQSALGILHPGSFEIHERRRNCHEAQPAGGPVQYRLMSEAAVPSGRNCLQLLAYLLSNSPQALSGARLEKKRIRPGGGNFPSWSHTWSESTRGTWAPESPKLCSARDVFRIPMTMHVYKHIVCVCECVHIHIYIYTQIHIYIHKHIHLFILCG